MRWERLLWPFVADAKGHVGLAGVHSLWEEAGHKRKVVFSQALWSACHIHHSNTSVKGIVSPVLQMGNPRLRTATLPALSHTAEIGTQVCLPPKP